MEFVGICLITEDMHRLTAFYREVLGATVEGDHIHATIDLAGAHLAIYSRRAAERDMHFDFGKYWGTGNFTMDFHVADVDAEYERLKSLGVEFITTPKTHPWGARSVQFRDPDGNIINFRCLGQ